MSLSAEGPLRILLVEDDNAVAKPLVRFLERQALIVSHSTLGGEAIEVAGSWQPHVVLLDLSLPDMDGIDVARALREALPGVALIMVTARGDEKDRVIGLETGADDYLVKPFGTNELLARIHAVMRRVAAGASATPAPPNQAGPFRLDAATGRAFLDGNDLGLTQKEFEILRILLQRRGSMVRREELARAVWNAPLNEVAKTLDVHLVWLRRKLGESARKPRYLETVRGAGLRMLPEPEE